MRPAPGTKLAHRLPPGSCLGLGSLQFPDVASCLVPSRSCLGSPEPGPGCSDRPSRCRQDGGRLASSPGLFFLLCFPDPPAWKTCLHPPPGALLPACCSYQGGDLQKPMKPLRASQVALGERIHLQCERCGFNPWVGKIPWRRRRQPTPVFLPGESYGQRSLLAGNNPGVLI